MDKPLEHFLKNGLKSVMFQYKKCLLPTGKIKFHAESKPTQAI